MPAEKKRQGRHDPFVGSKSVEGLSNRNWEDFMSEKEVSMVMFYDPSEPQCEWSKKHFLKAAKTTFRENHGYAAVDCTLNEELCANQGISTYPSFKLFANGMAIDTYTKPMEMTYVQIKKFVENTPPMSLAPPCVKPCEKEKYTCGYSTKR